MESVVEQSSAGAEEQTQRRSPAQWLKLIFGGYLIGSGNVVPGVSGGTMAFILGVYEELVESLRMAGQPETYRALFSFEIKKALRLIHAGFLAAIMIGALLAVITLVPGLGMDAGLSAGDHLEFLLRTDPGIGSHRRPQHSPLVDHRWRPPCLIGAVGAYLVVGMVPVQTPETWWFLMLSGALAICAMILPGLSGSFILVLLGQIRILRARRERPGHRWRCSGPRVGAVIGLVTFAQVLSWLFKRYRDVTVAVLTGFMLGSLRKVWPWKETLEFTTDRHGELVPLIERNVLPALQVNGSFNMEIVYALVAALLGLALVLLIERWGANDQPVDSEVGMLEETVVAAAKADA